MSNEERLISSEKRGEDIDTAMRPQSLDEFTGQAEARANLKVFIEAAKNRGEALDHVLFVGPPGLGKTTLATIIAAEMGVNIRITSGPAIEKQGDLAALLTNLGDGDILFIDLNITYFHFAKIGSFAGKYVQRVSQFLWGNSKSHCRT